MPIVAISGGNLNDGETIAIDRYIVGLADAKRPNALFIPTASGDAPSYAEAFTHVYGRRLGCEIRVLNLITENEDAAALIEWADIVYVGGGNTRLLMNTWKKHGVDRLLIDAWRRGVVLSGLSAGAICWFESGFSDANRWERDDDDWGFTEIEALGIVPGIFCPHLDSEHRLLPFLRHMRTLPKTGYAGMEGSAFVWDGSTPRVLAIRDSAEMFRLVESGGHVSIETMTARVLS